MNKIISFLIFAFVLVVLTISFVNLTYNAEKSIEKKISYKSCYDKHGNEILGQTCKEVNYVGGDEYFFAIILNMVIIIFWIMIYLRGEGL